MREKEELKNALEITVELLDSIESLINRLTDCRKHDVSQIFSDNKVKADVKIQCMEEIISGVNSIKEKLLKLKILLADIELEIAGFEDSNTDYVINLDPDSIFSGPDYIKRLKSLKSSLYNLNDFILEIYNRLKEELKNF